MNSPDSLLELYRVANAENKSQQVYTAELMREVGLKCIGFNGVSAFVMYRRMACSPPLLDVRVDA